MLRIYDIIKASKGMFSQKTTLANRFFIRRVHMTEQKQRNPPQKSRDFSIVGYWESKSDLLKTMEELLEKYNLRYYAFIEHNKDDKERHFHVALHFYNQRRLTSVRNMFSGLNFNVLVQYAVDKYKLVNKYFTHTDKASVDARKEVYNRSEIHSNGIEHFQARNEEEHEKTLNILDDITKGVSLYELARRYGRDLVINFEKYYAFTRWIEDYNNSNNFNNKGE